MKVSNCYVVKGRFDKNVAPTRNILICSKGIENIDEIFKTMGIASSSSKGL